MGTDTNGTAPLPLLTDILQSPCACPHAPKGSGGRGGKNDPGGQRYDLNK